MRLRSKQMAAWRQAKSRLLLPIIYIRGFAMGGGEIEETSADPFNGFNVGSTLLRTAWTGETTRHVFESPVLRLSQPPYDYRVSFSDGIRGLDPEAKRDLKDWCDDQPAECRPHTGGPCPVLAIYRYYDAASKSFGAGTRPGMETYAWGLGRLITDVLAATGAKQVYLVAHSMGGLVARAFLQNDDVLDGSGVGQEGRCDAVKAMLEGEERLTLTGQDWAAARTAVRRLFTYGTPHNGISGRGGFGNGLLGPLDSLLGLELDNFAHERMLQYLGNPPVPNSLGGRFPVSKVFCLVGTSAADYPAAGGFSRRLVGQQSDGLVEVENAVAHGPPEGNPQAPLEESVLAARAYVRRAHSGPFGLVNSEEGFGNLSRFLFGDLRVDGDLLIRRVELPPKVLQDAGPGATIRASYNFEASLRVRGERWVLTERAARDGSAVFRRYDELFAAAKLATDIQDTDRIKLERARHRRIELFSMFLDTGLRTMDKTPELVGGKERSGTLGFALRLRAAVPDYEVDGTFFRTNHFEGSALLDQDLVFLAFQDDTLKGGWGLAWGPNTPGDLNAGLQVITQMTATVPDAVDAVARVRTLPDAVEFWMPLQSAPGPAGPNGQPAAPSFQAWLRLTARSWNQDVLMPP